MGATEPAKKLYRSRSNRYIAGVCAGVAEYFDVDPTMVRLLTLLSVLIPGPQFIVYIIAWIVIPEEPVDYTQ